LYPWYIKSTKKPAGVHGNVTYRFLHAPAQLGTNSHTPQTRAGSVSPPGCVLLSEPEQAFKILAGVQLLHAKKYLSLSQVFAKRILLHVGHNAWMKKG